MNTEEPIVLGKVKKGSAGKPLVVIILFLFMGAILFFLPTIISYFGDYSIIELVKNGEFIDFFVNHDSYVDKPTTNNKEEKEEQIKEEPLLINSKTVLKYNDLTLTNFNLTKDNITFKINTTDTINFDESNYYLELTQNDKKLTTIKLTNSNNQFTFKEKLTDTINVKGIIKLIKESDYPEYIVSSDESGLGSLFCIKDNYKIEYILNNNNLIRVKETLNYIDSSNNYLKTFEEYSLIANKLNSNNQTASITENYNGFIYTTDIDLSTYNLEKNYNYYSLNTKTNKIYYEMNAKGFDCK